MTGRNAYHAGLLKALANLRDRLFVDAEPAKSGTEHDQRLWRRISADRGHNGLC